MARRATRSLRARARRRGDERTPLAVACAAGAIGILLAAPAVHAQTAGLEPRATPIPPTPVASSADLDVAEARVTYVESLDLLVFEQVLRGSAGKTTPRRRGALDGAPVLAYLFPTSLAPAEVGFSSGSGTVALAVTAHPDFDDTPLWDESGNRHHDDDGAVWHTHWMLLAPDRRTRGELRVDERAEGDASSVPPTAPDLPLRIDSPGFAVRTSGDTLRVLVPADRVSRNTSFRYDAATAYLQYSTAEGSPTLGVHEIYDVLSGDIGKLPYSVKRE